MTTARRLLALLLASVLVFAAACGGDDDDSADTGGGDDAGTSVDDALRSARRLRHDPGRGRRRRARRPRSSSARAPTRGRRRRRPTTSRSGASTATRSSSTASSSWTTASASLGADGVVVENMTARNYTVNGFFWTGVDGYRGSYLTDLPQRRLRHLRLRLDQRPDRAQLRVGQPRRRLLHRPVLPVRRRDRRRGRRVQRPRLLGHQLGRRPAHRQLDVPRTTGPASCPTRGSYELCYPERETTIVGNLVYSNNQRRHARPSTSALLGQGNGILVAGGVDNAIERNLVYDHDRTGIGLVPFPEEDASDDVPPPEDDDSPARRPSTSPRRPGDDPRPAAVEPAGQPGGRQRRVRLAAGRPRRRVARRRLGASATASPTTSSRPRAPLDLETLAPCEGEGSGRLDRRGRSTSWPLADGRDSRRRATTRRRRCPRRRRTCPTPTRRRPRRFDGPPEVDLDAIDVPARPE